MSDYIRKDRIRNIVTREKIGVTPIFKKMQSLVLGSLSMCGEDLMEVLKLEGDQGKL